WMGETGLPVSLPTRAGGGGQAGRPGDAADTAAGDAVAVVRWPPARYPGPMGDLANVFSGSRSRNGGVQECRRRYFYHYYGSWGGWAPEAPPEVRRLYVLKQLTGRQGWAGRVVHQAIEMSLKALHAGSELPERWLLDETIRRMREEWRFSRSGG